MSSKHQTEKLNPFSLEQWIGWLVASAVGVGGLAAFLYMNFQTRESFVDYRTEHERFEVEIVRRLERIEDKVDQILGRH